MERDEAGINFSPDDPENVSMPESLGPIAWEFFGTIAYRIKKQNNPAIMLECLECLKTIQLYKKNFLTTERRFEKMIFPSIKNYYLNSDKTSLSYLELRILVEFSLILKELSLENTDQNKSFLQDIKEFCRYIEKFIQNSEESTLTRNLKDNLERLNNL